MIGGVPVQSVVGDDGRSAIVWLAKMSVCVDGAPTAYYPGANTKKAAIKAGALDVGRNQTTFVAAAKDPTKHALQPSGFLVSPTALTDPSPAVAAADQHKYVDATQIPYIVVPGDRSVLKHVNKGDFAIAFNTLTGRIVYGIYAEVGPAGSIGEASIEAVDIVHALPVGKTHAWEGGVDSRSVIYAVFPGTKKNPKWPISVHDIVAAAANAFDSWGGFDKLRQLYPGKVLDREHQGSAPPTHRTK